MRVISVTMSSSKESSERMQYYDTIINIDIIFIVIMCRPH